MLETYIKYPRLDCQVIISPSVMHQLFCARFWQFDICLNHRSHLKNPNIENRNPYCFQGVCRKQIRNPNAQMSKTSTQTGRYRSPASDIKRLKSLVFCILRFWSLEFVSSFDIRISPSLISGLNVTRLTTFRFANLEYGIYETGH